MNRSNFLALSSAALAAASIPAVPAAAVPSPGVVPLSEWFAAENAWRMQGGAALLARAVAKYPEFKHYNEYTKCEHEGCDEQIFVDRLCEAPGPLAYLTDDSEIWKQYEYVVYVDSIQSKICDSLYVENTDINSVFTNTGGHGGTYGVCPKHWADAKDQNWFNGFEHLQADCPGYKCYFDRPECKSDAPDSHKCYASCGECNPTSHECPGCGVVAGGYYFGDLCYYCLFVKGRNTLTDPQHVAYCDYILDYLHPMWEAARVPGAPFADRFAPREDDEDED